MITNPREKRFNKLFDNDVVIIATGFGACNVYVQVLEKLAEIQIRFIC